jgi:hypothetical protein
MCQRETDR